MIVELPRARVEDLKTLADELADQPDMSVSLQCLSDLFCTIPADVLVALNRLYQAVPHLGLRLYSAMDHQAPVDLDNIRALPELQHLELHYGVPAIVDVAPLSTLRRLKTAELEIRAAYPLGAVLKGWQDLEELTLIREGKSSKAVDVSGIAGLAKLRDLYVMGYAKGISALAECSALTSLRLQSLTLPNWDALPPQSLDLLRLNAVKGPEPVPFAELHQRATRVELIRMDKTLPFDRARALSKIAADGWFTIDIDYLNGFHDDEWSGHDWANVLSRACPPPEGVTFDPEAGSLSVVGARTDLSNYQLHLLVTIAAMLSK